MSKDWKVQRAACCNTCKHWTTAVFSQPWDDNPYDGSCKLHIETDADGHVTNSAETYCMDYCDEFERSQHEQ